MRIAPVRPSWIERVVVVALIAAATAVSLPRPAVAQDAGGGNIETDPIRCWWRTSAGAVRTGETFSVVLTCAVLDIEEVQAVPDETRLSVGVMQLTPFEVIGGSHPDDLRRGRRRFFQYEYILRAINPDLIGHDVPLPSLEVHYRINSRIPGNAALEGRDLSYVLPPESVRVLSMVPEKANDIRDATAADLGRVEVLTSRAGVLEVVAVTLMMLGSLMTLLAIVSVVRRVRPRTATGPRPASPFTLARLAGRELGDVQTHVGRTGWNPTLISRALAATRIASACAIDRPVAQRPVGGRPAGDSDGWLLHRRLGRRGGPVAVSSAVTTADLVRTLDKLPASASSERRRMLDSLGSALTSFGTSQYSRNGELDRTALDAALADAVEQTRRVQMERLWPRELLRRWTPGRQVEQGA